MKNMVTCNALFCSYGLQRIRVVQVSYMLTLHILALRLQFQFKLYDLVGTGALFLYFG